MLKLGREFGLLDAEYLPVAQRALQAIVERVDREGKLEDVSYGTNVGLTLDHYRNIRLEPMQYGQGLAMLAVMESMIEEEALKR